MCNELVMPATYVEVSEDEMTYVDGGGSYRIGVKYATLEWIAIQTTAGCTVYGAVSSAIGPFTAGLGWVGSLISAGIAGIASIIAGSLAKRSLSEGVAFYIPICPKFGKNKTLFCF